MKKTINATNILVTVSTKPSIIHLPVYTERMALAFTLPDVAETIIKHTLFLLVAILLSFHFGLRSLGETIRFFSLVYTPSIIIIAWVAWLTIQGIMLCLVEEKGN